LPSSDSLKLIQIDVTYTAGLRLEIVKKFDKSIWTKSLRDRIWQRVAF